MLGIALAVSADVCDVLIWSDLIEENHSEKGGQRVIAIEVLDYSVSDCHEPESRREPNFEKRERL